MRNDYFRTALCRWIPPILLVVCYVFFTGAGNSLRSQSSTQNSIPVTQDQSSQSVSERWGNQRDQSFRSHSSNVRSSAHCLVGQIRPGMLLRSSLVKGTVAKLRTFDQPECFVYLKKPDLEGSVNSDIDSWIQKYEVMLADACKLVKFQVLYDTPVKDEKTGWNCGLLAERFYRVNVSLPQQMLLEQCLKDIEHEEKYMRSSAYSVITKVRVDAIWEATASNTSSYDEVIFSANRNPPCGFGAIDWFISAPRKYAATFFYTRNEICPAEAWNFTKVCEEPRCFGNECMNVYFAMKNGIPFSFVDESQSPILPHWLGDPKSFS